MSYVILLDVTYNPVIQETLSSKIDISSIGLLFVLFIAGSIKEHESLDPLLPRTTQVVLT